MLISASDFLRLSNKILSEIMGKQRDKIYVYRKYLDILELGADPF